MASVWMSHKRKLLLWEYLVTLEDTGVLPPQSILETAQVFEVNEATVRDVIRQGELEDWPLPELPEKIAS